MTIALGLAAFYGGVIGFMAAWFIRSVMEEWSQFNRDFYDPTEHGYLVDEDRR